MRDPNVDVQPGSVSPPPTKIAAVPARLTCPHCDKQHVLPRVQLGKRARCNGCQTIFVISRDLLVSMEPHTASRSVAPSPDASAAPATPATPAATPGPPPATPAAGGGDQAALADALGDFLSDMLEEHLDEADAAVEAAVQAQAAMPEADAAQASSGGRPPTSRRTMSSSQVSAVHESGLSSLLSSGRTTPPPTTPSPTTDPKTEAPDSDGTEATCGVQAEPTADAEALPGQQAQSNARDVLASLTLDPSRPHLAVRQVRLTGVTLAFRERCMHHPRFRLSFPRACAFSGDREGTLIARPMIFINHHTGEEEARNLEMKYEHTLTPGTPLEIVAEAIDRVEGMAQPFDRPLLYFASQEYFDSAVHCQAFRPSQEWGYCEVTIPNPQVALAWFAAINGVCDPQYLQLAAAVSQLSDEAWQRLPSETRNRIAVWCRFMRDEHFVAYARDADLPAKDAGLGGVVLTNQRLISRRFRNTEMLLLDQLEAVHLENASGVVKMRVEAADGRAFDLNPIPRGDAPFIFDALEQAVPDLKIHTAGPDVAAA